VILMVIKVDEGKWYIYTPDGRRYNYCLENIVRALGET
jgi:hypothetical protein